MSIETVKLKNTKDGSVIERKKIDYEANAKVWSERGWILDDGKKEKTKTVKKVTKAKKTVKKLTKKKKSKK